MSYKPLAKRLDKAAVRLSGGSRLWFNRAAQALVGGATHFKLLLDEAANIMALKPTEKDDQNGYKLVADPKGVREGFLSVRGPLSQMNYRAKGTRWLSLTEHNGLFEVDLNETAPLSEAAEADARRAAFERQARREAYSKGIAGREAANGVLSMRQFKQSHKRHCEICEKHGAVVSDHCHECGDKRALICSACNIRLGFYEKILRGAELPPGNNYQAKMQDPKWCAAARRYLMAKCGCWN